MHPGFFYITIYKNITLIQEYNQFYKYENIQDLKQNLSL